MTPASKHDRALALSRKMWGEPRLGSIDPDQEPYRSTLESERIHVINVTGVTSADQLNHGTFAENPQVVRLIGRIENGQTLTDSRVGLGERLMLTTTAAAASIGRAAGLVVSAPVAVVDPSRAKTTAIRSMPLVMGTVGQSIEDAAAPK